MSRNPILVALPSLPPTTVVGSLINAGDIDFSKTDGIDLSKVNINSTGAEWNFTTSNVDFTGSNLSDVEFLGAKLSDATIPTLNQREGSVSILGESTSVSLKNVAFNGSIVNLERASFIPPLSNENSFNNATFTGKNVFPADSTIIASNALLDFSNADVTFPTPAPAGLLPGDVTETDSKNITVTPVTFPAGLNVPFTFTLSKIGRHVHMQFPYIVNNVRPKASSNAIIFTGLDLTGYEPMANTFGSTSVKTHTQGCNKFPETLAVDITPSGRAGIYTMTLSRMDSTKEFDDIDCGVTGGYAIWLTD